LAQDTEPNGLASAKRARSEAKISPQGPTKNHNKKRPPESSGGRYLVT
jgi:hypothetical protein